ncbi:MAG: MarR family transcriptional regulator [Acidimicrobiales bacterium]
MPSLCSIDEPFETGDIGLMVRVVELNLRMTRILEGITSAAGLTMADYLVLAVIRRSPDHRSAPGQIAKRLGRTSGGVSLALDRLEAAGWLQRSQDGTDRRRIVVELTPPGVAVATSVNRALHAWENSLDLSGAQRDQMAAVMDELSSLFETHIAEGPSTEPHSRDGRDHRLPDVAGSVSGDLTA